MTEKDIPMLGKYNISVFYFSSLSLLYYLSKTILLFYLEGQVEKHLENYIILKNPESF